MSNKNTRLIYTDETNLAVYRSLPDKDFKEFMMAYLTYKKGMDITKMFSNQLVETIFRLYVSKIEYNEDKWEKQAQARRENGKKGGRPKKNVDITANEDFDNEVPNNIPSVQFDVAHKEEEFEKDVEIAVNELAEIALYEKGKELFNEVLTKYSNSLSRQYNKLNDDVEERLREMSKEKYKELKEVS